MRNIGLILIYLFVANFVIAQEFNATVSISTPKLQTADPKIFKTLEQSMVQMINTTAWTNDEFEDLERIDLTINLNITEELSTTSFRANLLIQASRPIYNSDQQTVIFTHQDKQVSFVYEEYQPLEYSKNTFNNNITSIMSFYCYVILGLDYDSYSSLGGSEHFFEAQNIINTIPPNIAETFKGWRQQDGQRNRYWLVENILNPRVEPYRKAMYDYHIRGLDMMANDIEAGRTSISNAITEIAAVNRAYPNTMIMQIFSNSKRSELLEIFVASETKEKQKIYNAMVKIDAANSTKYTVLRR